MAVPGAKAATLGLTSTVGLARRMPRVIVLGIDGMDPRLVEKYVKQGRMPNTKRLIGKGDMKPLGTSTPPQSPVAWSNFISGMNPGGHGIFDFIHRDPATRMPHLSTSRISPAEKTISIGSLVVPLSGGKAELLRRGPTFWKTLEEHDVDCTVVKMPANFPPTPVKSKTLSGLGAPDVLGTYGTFSYFTSDPAEVKEDVGGGRILRVYPKNGKVEANLIGPQNSFRKDAPDCTVPFTVYCDSTNAVAKITVQGKEIILKVGEWSDWVTIRFEMLRHLASMSAVCRFYLKSTRPHFRLYVSPINMDPADPALPICTPDNYSKKLAERIGPFYTQGMPEDTKALSAGVLSDEEYLQQAKLVLEERLRMYDCELGRFERGFFFFYFSSLDLNSHMLWRALDRGHPQYSAKLANTVGDFMPMLYGEMDKVIGKAMEHVGDDDLLMVMSDHGFASFRRGFNLNTWLLRNKYAAIIDPFSQEDAEFFMNTDWTETKAYGLGINSIYFNISGREPGGIVSPGDEARELADELKRRLKEVRDPETGERAILNVYAPSDAYSGPCTEDAPDLVVGYNQHYRASWDTILGEYPKAVFEDNTDPWSGDHCMDRTLIPGSFICNKPIRAESPNLYDLTPTILAEFNVPVPPEMIGKAVL